MRGKKYHKKRHTPLKKEKRKKRQGKGKEKWQNNIARTMFQKFMGNLGINAGIRGHNTIPVFFPLSPVFLIVTPKRVQKSNWGKIYDILSPCLFIMGNLGKNAGSRGHNIIFFPPKPKYYFNEGKKKIS
jgi:hypothetical protein